MEVSDQLATIDRASAGLDLPLLICRNDQGHYSHTCSLKLPVI